MLITGATLRPWCLDRSSRADGGGTWDAHLSTGSGSKNKIQVPPRGNIQGKAIRRSESCRAFEGHLCHPLLQCPSTYLCPLPPHPEVILKCCCGQIPSFPGWGTHAARVLTSPAVKPVSSFESFLWPVDPELSVQQVKPPISISHLHESLLFISHVHLC